jgi:hypothetical protein
MPTPQGEMCLEVPELLGLGPTQGGRPTPQGEGGRRPRGGFGRHGVRLAWR